LLEFLFVRASARCGDARISTPHWHDFAIIRRILRMRSWQNYVFLPDTKFDFSLPVACQSMMW
jgi:hypothetical protein